MSIHHTGGWHATNMSAFKLAHEYAREGMSAYVRLQEDEFANQSLGYTAVRHQSEVGTGYFDRVLNTISGGEASTAALKGSTEEQQFTAHVNEAPVFAILLVISDCLCHKRPSSGAADGANTGIALIDRSRFFSIA
jgi:hypothetical protein